MSAIAIAAEIFAAATPAAAPLNPIRTGPAPMGGFPECGKRKKSLNYFMNEPKDWPNSTREFFLDNPPGAWDITRDFLGGRSTRNMRAYRMNNLIVN